VAKSINQAYLELRFQAGYLCAVFHCVSFMTNRKVIKFAIGNCEIPVKCICWPFTHLHICT